VSSSKVIGSCRKANVVEFVGVARVLVVILVVVMFAKPLWVLI